MGTREIQEFVRNYIENKLEENNKYIRCTFYDIRVKNNLNEKEANEFLTLTRNYLENKNFSVYFTNSKFIYMDANRTVQSNELFVAYKS